MAKQKRRATEPDLLGRFWNNLKLATRLLFDRRVSGTVKLIPVVMLAYILSPVDLFPDLFLPLGILDDILALVFGLQLFILSAPPDVVAEYRHKPKRGKFKSDEPKVIEGQYKIKDSED